MNSTLKPDEIEYFFIRLYFDTTEGLLHAAMQRAYRDFSRTIQNIPIDKIERKKWRYQLYSVLEEQTSFILNTPIQGQDDFDEWHRSACSLLVTNSDNILTIGQTQKWVNMALKYLYSFGEIRMVGIGMNYKYFHIPIDNIIQNALEAEYGIQRISKAWSRINDYAEYMEYQQNVRKTFAGRIVMDEEFRLFNKNYK